MKSDRAEETGFKSDRRDASLALAEVSSFLQAGDTVNVSGRVPWYKFWYAVPYRGIRCNQRRIFGSQSIWHDTHCMLYLDPAHTLSVEPPKGRWLKVEDYFLDRLSIWRFTKPGRRSGGFAMCIATMPRSSRRPSGRFPAWARLTLIISGGKCR